MSTKSELRQYTTSDFDEIWHTHYDYMRNIVNNILPDYADDILQEIAIVIFKRITSFRGTCQLTSWLYMVVTTRALMYRRKLLSKTKLLVFGLRQDLYSQSFEVPRFDEALDARRKLIWLYKNSNDDDKLDPTRQLCLKGLLQGKDVSEIASDATLKRNAIRTAMQRVRRESRVRLKRYYGVNRYAMCQNC